MFQQTRDPKKYIYANQESSASSFYTKCLTNLKNKDKGNYRSSCHLYHCHCFQEKNTSSLKIDKGECKACQGQVTGEFLLRLYLYIKAFYILWIHYKKTFLEQSKSQFMLFHKQTCPEILGTTKYSHKKIKLIHYSNIII